MVFRRIVDLDTRLKNKDIRKFQGICKLMDKVNKEPSTTQNADSALVKVYNTKNAGIDFHDDGEKLIDSKSSISAVSFGTSRTIEFCRRVKWPRSPELSLKVENHDLMVMKPGCQEHLVHRVCPGTQSNGWRVLISLRKLSPLGDDNLSLNPEVSIIYLLYQITHHLKRGFHLPLLSY